MSDRSGIGGSDRSWSGSYDNPRGDRIEILVIEVTLIRVAAIEVVKKLTDLRALIFSII